VLNESCLTYVRHYSLSCETWLVLYVGHISRCYVRHDSFDKWDMTHWYVRHTTRSICGTRDSVLCETWLVYYVRHDLFTTCDMTCLISETWLIGMWDTWLVLYVGHISRCYVRHDSFDKWDMTHWYVRHMTRLICGTRDSVLCKTWLVYYVRHDSLVCQTHDSFYMCDTSVVAMWDT